MAKAARLEGMEGDATPASGEVTGAVSEVGWVAGVSWAGFVGGDC